MAHLLLLVMAMEHIKNILEELEEVEIKDLPIVLTAVMVKMRVRHPDGLQQIQACLMDVIYAELEMRADQTEQDESNRNYH